ncbi:MAG: hypothetical protein R6V22_01820 [Rhodohalobacter sp.]|uniref:hypothetical protein n=1 Tax=Rhodohalobacter sp. TaxID=1974210 RepID=UPI003975DDF3
MNRFPRRKEGFVWNEKLNRGGSNQIMEWNISSTKLWIDDLLNGGFGLNAC